MTHRTAIWRTVLILAACLATALPAWAQEKPKDRDGRRPPARPKAQKRDDAPRPWVFEFKHIPAESFLDTLQQLGRSEHLAEIFEEIPIALNVPANSVVMIAPPEILRIVHHLAESLDHDAEFHRTQHQRGIAKAMTKARIEAIRKGAAPKAPGCRGQDACPGGCPGKSACPGGGCRKGAAASKAPGGCAGQGACLGGGCRKSAASKASGGCAGKGACPGGGCRKSAASKAPDGCGGKGVCPGGGCRKGAAASKVPGGCRKGGEDRDRVEADPSDLGPPSDFSGGDRDACGENRPGCRARNRDDDDDDDHHGRHHRPGGCR